jgi:hypothetical protein
MKRHFASLIALVAICLLISSVAIAQTTSGEIRGRVVDSADAALTGAEVILTNELTGEHLTTTTNNSGDFSFVGLQPGVFTVSAKAPGFKQFDKRELRLSASERLSAGTLKLQVGAVTQTMTVTAEATPLQTESSERSALLDSKEISTLMTPGRDVLSLVRLLPGVVKDGEGAGQLGTQGPGTVSGVRESSNAVTVDGTTGNVRGDGNKLDTPLNMDAVGEVKILLNNYQAEYGQSAGAIINLTTKSGTQQFHGSGYYYGRNEAFNANSWFNNNAGQPRGQYRFNTVGYNIGGPVYIPGHVNRNKDKLFFFFSQEIWPTQTLGDLQRFMMPTQLERNGDFSQSFDKSGKKVYVGDPLLLAQGKKCSATDPSGCFPGNVIPANRINPNMQKMMTILPLPNKPCASAAECTALGQINSSAFYNFLLLPNRKQPTNQQVLRLDYNLANKWRMFFRGMNMSNENRGVTATANKTPWGIPAYYKTPARNASVNLTYMATPTLVNEFTVGYADWKELQNFADATGPALLEKDKLGVSIGQNNPAQNPLNLVPRITGLGNSSGNTTFAIGNAPSIDFDNRFPMKNSTGTWEGTDGLTKIWGRHTSKVGAYYQAGRYLQRHIGSTFDGNFDFRTSSSNPNDSQYAYANWLLGNFNSYSEGSRAADYAPHWKILEWYAQDNWKLRPNLSLDYGVRFTYDMPTELAPGFGAGFVQSRYDPTQVVPLYKPVKYTSLSSAQQALCRGGAAAVPTRCAQNPLNAADIKPDVAIASYVGAFSYTGTVINTDPTFPHSLRNSNGVLYAPRLGFAWDPFNTGKTVLRFGAGLYYNTREGGGTVGDYSLIAPIVSNPTINYGNVSTFTANCNTAPNGCTGAGLLNTPQQTRVLQPDRKIESTLSTNFGIQRKFGFDTVMDIGYVGTFGRHLNQQVDLNLVPYLSQFLPQNIDTTQSAKTFLGGTVSQQVPLNDNFFRPTPGYGSVNLREYGGTSNYNALQTSINRRFTKGLQFGVSYTWSKTMATQDSVNGAVARFQDRRWWNYSEASFDRTHNFVAHWVWSVPKASSLWDNKFMRAIGDNWEWSGIAEFVSGAPQSITNSNGIQTIDVNGLNFTGGGDGARVLLIRSPLAPSSQVHTTKQFADKFAFALPPVGVIPNPNIPGITRNNVFRGPGTNNWDMGLQKNIPVTERVKLALRCEAYNVFNHPSFSSVDMAVHFDSNTGLPTSSSTFGQVNKERQARILQLSGRVTF